MSVLTLPTLPVRKNVRRYCEDESGYRRRPTREVMVGDVGVGGTNPIRIQSMTTTDTMDTLATVRQITALADAGCEIVRVTAPSIKEAENLKAIRDHLRAEGVKVPLVADIHFTPNAALKAAEFVEKVRINPGNYADKKKFAVLEYSERAYVEELERLETAFKPLVLKCKALGVAMRIGTNHGSLSDRIMNRYGDTPQGMVESALEFVDICVRYDYHDLVLSMKASNVQVMIAAYRLLAARMYERGMDYPFHLGVTEAGDGDDGRIKSAVGIGSLLQDGIGDTVRVSLTEDSVQEIPAASQIVSRFSHTEESSSAVVYDDGSPFSYGRRWTQTVETRGHNYGGIHHVRVEGNCGIDEACGIVDRLADRSADGDARVESLRITPADRLPMDSLRSLRQRIDDRGIRLNLNITVGAGSRGYLEDAAEIADIITIPWLGGVNLGPSMFTAIARDSGLNDKLAIQWSLSTAGEKEINEVVDAVHRSYAAGFRNVMVEVRGHQIVHVARKVRSELVSRELSVPMALCFVPLPNRSTLFDASIELGSLLCDGIGDSILIEDPALDFEKRIRLSYDILQACRLRVSKTEFISCPSCGRTLFDLQEVTARIKSKTGHLKGVKIAIMGCIVNGPGEMADADFGYVGASAGKINLYVGKELVERNIDMNHADERLVALIKDHGKWNEPAASET